MLRHRQNGARAPEFCERDVVVEETMSPAHAESRIRVHPYPPPHDSETRDGALVVQLLLSEATMHVVNIRLIIQLSRLFGRPSTRLPVFTRVLSSARLNNPLTSLCGCVAPLYNRKRSLPCAQLGVRECLGENMRFRRTQPKEISLGFCFSHDDTDVRYRHMFSSFETRGSHIPQQQRFSSRGDF